MKVFIKLFLTILFPASILSILIAIAYFSTDYDLTKAIRLGTISGMLIAISATFALSILAFITKSLDLFKRKNTLKTMHKDALLSHDSIHKKVLLLMDKELAFEVSTYAILDQNIGHIINGDKSKGELAIRTQKEHINLSISALTKHTSQITLEANLYNDPMKKIIHYLKLQERSFINY